MVAVQLKKVKERGLKNFSTETKNQSLIRNFRGKLQWSGNLDEMRTDK